jgi:hypothetical protein
VISVKTTSIVTSAIGFTEYHPPEWSVNTLDTLRHLGVWYFYMERESVKVSVEIMKDIREIAERDGMVLAILVDRLLREALEARENPFKRRTK